ncbi:hypothetical protein KCU88_g6779, partial [Aureobasidium melanogenum]
MSKSVDAVPADMVPDPELGGSSGIGLAMTKRFAHAGAFVTIADIATEQGTLAASDLTSQGCSVNFVRCDVKDFDSCVAAFNAALCFCPTGSLDVVALIAGVAGEPGSLVDQVIHGQAGTRSEGCQDKDPVRPAHSGIDVNLTAVYECTYLALWYLSLKKDGKDKQGTEHSEEKIAGTSKTKEGTKSLILISSTVAYTDVPLFSDYQTSKLGVRGLFRGLRHSTLELNVRLNTLAPYFVHTPLVTKCLPILAEKGILEGKGITFVNIDRVVDAAARLAVDESLHGRSLAVVPGPHGVIDLKDDEDGMWAGEVVNDILKTRRAAGDLM